MQPRNRIIASTQTDALMTDYLVIAIPSTNIAISFETDLCFNRCCQNGSQAHLYEISPKITTDNCLH